MMAIEITFHGPTNHRGSRYRAKCEWGSITVPADHNLSPADNAGAAAVALARKCGWNEHLKRAPVLYRGTTRAGWVVVFPWEPLDTTTGVEVYPHP